MRLFKPFIWMMKPLKYVQRFAFIGVILVIPIVFMSIIFIVDTNHEIDTFEKRLTGATCNKLLKELLREVQQYRGLTMGEINGDFSQESARLEIEKVISQDFKEIDNYIRERDMIASSSQMVLQLKHEWNEIVFGESNNPLEMMERQTDFIAKIMDTMIQVADESKLFLTKTDYTYYMIQDAVKTLPQLTEQLGQIRAIGMAIAARGEANVQEILYINSLLPPVKGSISELKHAKKVLARSYPTLNAAFNPAHQEVVRETDYFLNYVQRELIESKPINVKAEDFFAQATKAIDASFALYDLETTELGRVIEEQMVTLKWHRNMMIVLICVALSLTLYGFLGFFFSIRNSMDELTTAGYLFFYRNLFSPQIKKAEKKYQVTKRKLKEVRNELSLRVLQAQEDERKRIARELHDGVGQSLYATLIRLTIAESAPAEKNKEEHLCHAKKGISDAMKEIKGIAHSLRPGSLDDLGFIPALQSYMSDYEKTYGIQVDFICSEQTERLTSAAETALYRICQEAFTNIAKHSQASCVQLAINMNDIGTHLTIQDNGIGFSVKDYYRQHQHKKGIGLLSMEERVRAYGGTFKISSIENEGTRLSVSIPRTNL